MGGAANQRKRPRWLIGFGQAASGQTVADRLETIAPVRPNGPALVHQQWLPQATPGLLHQARVAVILNDLNQFSKLGVLSNTT